MNLLVIVIFFWITASLGCRILVAGRLDCGDGALSLAVGGGIGLGFFSLAATVLGLLGGFNPYAAWGLVIAAAALAGRELIAWPGRIPAALSDLWRTEPIWAVRGCLVFLGLVTGLMILAAHAPITFCDSLHYHMEIPKHYIAAGRLFLLDMVDMAGLPHGGEILFTLGKLLVGDVFDQLLPIAAAGLVVCGLIGLSRRFGLSPAIGLVAGAILYSQPVWIQYFPVAMTDVPLVLYGIGTVGCWLLWREDRRTGWLVVAALLGGAAAQTKLNGGAMALTVFLLLSWQCIVKERSIRLPVLFAGLVLLIGVHWFVVNYLWHGNPFYPFEIGPIKTPGLSPALREFIHQESYKNLAQYTPYSLWGLISMPFARTMETSIYGSLNPLFVTFLPLAFLFRRPAIIGRLLAVCLVFYLILFPLSGQERWLGAVFPMVSLVCAWTAFRLFESGPWLKRITTLVLGLALIFGLAYAFGFVGYTARGALGLDNRAEYLAKRTQYYRAYEWINTHAKPNVKVAIPRFRGYYLDRPYITWDESFIDALGFDRMKSTDDLIARLRELGVGYIVVPRRLGEVPDKPLLDLPLGLRRYRLINQASAQGKLEKVFASDKDIVYHPVVR